MGSSLRVSTAFVHHGCLILIGMLSLGVPYHSWRITHAKHHASTAHLTQDQVFVPKTRKERKLPEFDPTQEDLAGSSVSEKVMSELWDALGDSPIGAVWGSISYLVRLKYISFIHVSHGCRRLEVGPCI